VVLPFYHGNLSLGRLKINQVVIAPIKGSKTWDFCNAVLPLSNFKIYDLTASIGPIISGDLKVSRVWGFCLLWE
jgi:hypothetical protein